MTLSAIRARLGSIPPSKLAEIEAVSPCAVKILGDVERLLGVAEAVKAKFDWQELLDRDEQPAWMNFADIDTRYDDLDEATRRALLKLLSNSEKS